MNLGQLFLLHLCKNTLSMSFSGVNRLSRDKSCKLGSFTEWEFNDFNDVLHGFIFFPPNFSNFNFQHFFFTLTL